MNIDKIHLELDSQVVVQMLNQKVLNYSAAAQWIQEIKNMLRSRSDFRVSWVSRSTNVAAHKLAKVGVGDELCNVWWGVTPDFVLDVISDDIPSYVG